MAETPNYHWHLTAEGEELTTPVEDWTRRLTSPDDSSVLMQLDKIISGLRGNTHWSEYLGEGISSLEIYWGRSKAEAEQTSTSNRVTLSQADTSTMSVSEANEFDPDISQYTATIPSGAQYIAVKAGSTGFANKFLSISCDGFAPTIGGLGAVVVAPIQAESGACVVTLTAQPSEQGDSDPDYTTYARSIFITFSRTNAITLGNLWVKDRSTDAASNPHRLEQMWLIDSEHLGKTNYDAGLVDQGEHAIFVSDCAQAKFQYGVMADTLQTELVVSLEAPGQNGSKYALLASEYAAQQPQLFSTVDTPGQGALTDIQFRVDPSQNGSQNFQFTIIDRETGAEGSCYLTVYRYGVTDGVEPAFQTYIKGRYNTMNTLNKVDGPDHAVQLTLYRKSQAMALLSVNKAFDAGLFTLPADKDDTYTNRFEAAKEAGLLTPVWSDVTDKATGGYIVTPNNIGGPGTYMLVGSRKGYLDNVVDNLILTKTWAVAEYNLSLLIARAGDLNHDGVINAADRDIFNKHLNQWTTSGVFDETTLVSDFNGDGLLANSDLNYILSQWGMSVTQACWLNNVTSKYRCALNPYDPATNVIDPHN